MNQCEDISYRYKEKIYEANPLQQEILRKIKSLPRKHLHYMVGQQSDTRPNINLNQMKSAIKRAVKKYVKESNYPYRQELDSKMVQYLCVFETTKEFNGFLYNEEVLEDTPKMGLHFHLFVTNPDNYSGFCFNTLSYYILHELSGFPKRSDCISKFDYRKLGGLNDHFILYHAKQFYQRPSRTMLMTNI